MEGVAGPRQVGQLPRFGILGPLRAWRDGRDLDLGPAKQRAVLAVLLVNANRPVSTSRVVDAVWADDPPQNGTNVVQKYVAGLRRLLEPERSARAPGTLLTRTDAGYLLRVPPGHLDLDTFQDGVRRARTARAEGRLADASAELQQAIAVWRGDALAGLNGTLFDTARDQLDESRAAAIEEWADVELTLGNHARLVPDLVRLVGEFPLREELRHLLILALYRCGRQAESLAAYRELREFLNEEFGIEPSERLQRLHQRILQGDPALSAGAYRQPERREEPTSPAPPAHTAQLQPEHPPEHPQPVAPPPGHVQPAPPDPPEQPLPAAPPAPPGLARSPVRETDPAHPGSVLPDGQTPATRPRNPWLVWAARVIGVLIPLASFGVLTWAVVAFLAGRRASWPLGLAAFGYFGCLAFFLYVANTRPASVTEAIDIAAMMCFFLSMFGGAVHVAVLDPGRREPAREKPVVTPAR